VISIVYDGTAAWPDVRPALGNRLIWQRGGIRVAAMPDPAGPPGVAFRIDGIIAGRAVIAVGEMTLQELLNAADVLKERFGDPRQVR
jgi:hypothetical protein